MNAEEKVRNYLSRIPAEDLSLGRTDLRDGDYVNVTVYDTRAGTVPVFEKHEQYIDGFYLLEGQEKALLSRSSTETLKAYSEKEDAGLYRCVAEQTVILKKGDLLMIDTDLYHAPGLAVQDPITVKKAIFKIKKRNTDE